MLDYDQEAVHYDVTRGGQGRAAAAAHALSRLLPKGARLAVDVAGGTGIVAAALMSARLRVVVSDTSQGMLRLAGERMPGRAVRADARCLPLADTSVDAVITLWLLHLLDTPSVESTVREAARVLRPGGRYLTTVDKSAAHGCAAAYTVTDGRGDVNATAAAVGLRPVDEGAFVGHGQSHDGHPDPVFALVAFEKVR